MPDDLFLFVRSFFIGLSVAAIVGPMSILCIQRTMRSGLWAGLISGLGIATADATYGAIAVSGLTLITTFIVHQQFWIRALGGIFLIYLGFRTFLTPPATRAAADTSATSLVSIYTTTYLLTLTNPLTILSFVAIFAGIGLGSSQSNSPFLAFLVVFCVFLGSIIWWIFLTSCIWLLRSRFPLHWLRWINGLSALALMTFGFLACITIFQR